MTKITSKTPQPWTKENLAKALNVAVAVEMFTIPVYLSAACSIQDANNYRSKKTIEVSLPTPGGNSEIASVKEKFSPYNVIMSVAVQEMFHLTMACNLANALGIRPDLTAPDLNTPPSCLTGIKGMPVKGNLSTLIDTMLAIEAPDPKYHYDETPTNNDPTHFQGPTQYQEEYDSIGDLYHAIAYGVKELWNYSSENDLYQKTSFSNKYQDVTAVIKTKKRCLQCNCMYC